MSKLDVNGNLAETNATHVFLVSDGTVLTSTTKACPAGITRSTLFELCRCHDIPYEQRDLSEQEIHGADEVFCTGTMGEIVAVTRIDSTVFHGGTSGPMTRQLAGLYQELTRSEGYSIV